MGLFSFLKNAGAKLFDKEEKKAPKTNTEEGRIAAETIRKQKIVLLKGVVDSLGIEVRDLDIDFYGDTVTIHGEVESQADREKVILSLGNVGGVAGVDDNIKVVKTEPEAVFYEVKKGDSLSKIAKKHYGNAMKYKIIFEANQPMLKDANLIYPGQMLRIPNLD